MPHLVVVSRYDCTVAKSVRPSRVRQAPPEVRCWTLTGRTALSETLFVNGTDRSVAKRRIMSSYRVKRRSSLRASAARAPGLARLSVLPLAIAPR